MWNADKLFIGVFHPLKYLFLFFHSKQIGISWSLTIKIHSRLSILKVSLCFSKRPCFLLEFPFEESSRRSQWVESDVTLEIIP